VVAHLDVIPDDGNGKEERVALGRLRAGRHVLQLGIGAGANAHGLCIYGDERTPLRIITR
jgi:hypothetical protein